ncbi:MAG TPA: FAD-binding protein [Terriglobia bacterium]|nr:FAD-binding protein [Terriglobia bacterium]
MSWTAELAGEIEGQVLTDEATRDLMATDFGRVIIRKPEVVVRPASSEDVARVVKFAARHSLGVATRGGGHSQTGQSLSEHIVLEMTSLERVLRVNEAEGVVVCQSGLKWRSLVEHLASRQLSPWVLTNNLDVTIGGTLSTAGLGVASWRHGTQADNCLALEVVTGTGEVVRCSPSENPDLFDAARGGVGQFGVITEATLKIRRHKPGFRSFYLLYDDLRLLLDDLQAVMTDERFDCLESWCTPCPQGFKKVGNQRQPFAQWFFPLHATVETDGNAPEPAEKLRGLKFYKHVHTEDGEIGDFFARLDTLFALWKRGGFWEYAHPWMECVLPWQTTPMFLTQVLQNLPPQVVVGGHILLWPARGDVSSTPLFMRPTGEFLMGFGILPAIPKHLVEEALPRLNLASQASTMMGGKRYLSGWIAFDQAQWKAHYGDMWTTVVSLKKRYDPHRVLNPGFVKYE